MATTLPLKGAVASVGFRVDLFSSVRRCLHAAGEKGRMPGE